MLEFLNLCTEMLTRDPSLWTPWEGQKGPLSVSERLHFHLSCLAIWETNWLFPLPAKRFWGGHGSSPRLRAGTAQSLDYRFSCDSGFWDAQLRASQVLAQGAGTSDVVRAMWKLSRVSSTQPSLELPKGGRASFTAVRSPCSDKQTQGCLCAYMSVCVCLYFPDV